MALDVARQGQTSEQSVLDSINSRLSGFGERLHSVVREFGGMLDRANGTPPANAAKSDKPREVPAGVLGGIQMRLDDIGILIDQLEHQANDTNRIV